MISIADNVDDSSTRRATQGLATRASQVIWEGGFRVVVLVGWQTRLFAVYSHNDARESPTPKKTGHIK